MPRVTRHGPSRVITATGVIGYDPDAPTGEVPDPIDYSDEAAWEYPAAASGIVALVNSFASIGAATNTFGSWGFTPTAGNLLVIGVAIRDGGSSTAPAGWTLLENNAPALGTGFDDGAALYGKVSDGTETSVTFAYGGVPASMHRIILEFSGIGLSGYITNEVTGTTGTAFTTGSVTPTAGSQALVIGLSAGNSLASPHTPGAGWTELYDAALGGPEHPATTLIYQIVASAAGSYNPSTTSSNSGTWRGVTAAFVEPADVVWLPAFAVNDDDNGTYDVAVEAAIDEASLVFLRGTLTTDYVLDSIILRAAMEDAGSVTVTVWGATLSDYSDEVVMATDTFTATGSYTAQTRTIDLAGVSGYTYLRFKIGTAQGVRVHEVTLYGPTLETSHSHTHDHDDEYLTIRYGGGDVLSTFAAIGATETIDLANGNVHQLTLNADCTFTFSGAVTGRARSFRLYLWQDATGGWDVTWPASVEWAGGVVPVLETTAETLSVFMFETLDGGTIWHGYPVGGAADPADIWRPVMAHDGTNWYVVVDGSGTAVMAQG